MTDRIFKIMVAVPFALIPLAAVAGKSVSFERLVLKPNESTVLEYSSASQVTIEMIERGPRAASLKTAKFNPFLAVENKPGSYLQDDPNGQAGDGQLLVTLTILNAGGNMAVIDDHLVREGDTIKGMRVKRIENNRVLLIDKKSAPVYLEGPK